MLTPKKVAAMRLLYDAQEWSIEDLSVLFGTSYTNAAKVIRGEIWKSVTGGVSLSRYREETEYRRVHIAAALEQGTLSLAAIGRQLGITGQAVGDLIRRYDIGGKADTCSED